MEQQKENAYLVDLILAKGDVDNVRFENAQDKINFLLNFQMQDNYKKLQTAKVDTMYETDMQNNANKTIVLNGIKSDLSAKAEEILKKRDIDIPLLLSEKEKENTIVNALSKLGLEKQDINAVLKNGLKNTEKITGENIILTFNDNDKTREILEKNNVVFKKTEQGLEVDANLVAQEGIEIDNNKKNKKILEENDITHYIQPDDPRKIFVPLRAKKMATLLAASIVVGPVPALALQIILNKTGVLDKMVDRHIITLKQRNALKNGQTVLTKQRIDGKDREQYLFKDATGNIKKINKEDVYIPNKLNNVQLTPAQKSLLREGKQVEIISEKGEKKIFTLDLNKTNGVSEIQKSRNKIDEELKIPTVISADSEKLEYIAAKGKTGLDDIFGNNPVNEERDKFLDTHNLRTEFRNYNEAEKSIKIAEINGEPTTMLLEKLNKIEEKFKDAVVNILLIDVENKQSKGYKR